MKHVLSSNGSWIDESSVVLKKKLDSWQLFQPAQAYGITDEKGKCPGVNVWIPR